jgi:hypothetical protein
MGNFFEALAMPGVLKEPEPEAPAKPTYLPVKRKVRVEDLEVGCVLRFCGNPPGTDYSGDCGGALKLGDLHKVTHIDGRVFLDVPGWEHKDDLGWTETGINAWEFVSNPNYVHGFRIGETVYCTNGDGGDKFQKLTVRAKQYPRRGPCLYQWVDCYGEFHGGLFHASTLTRDPTKAYGYKAQVEYKVKDGVAKEGDVIWWLASYGDPERVVVGGDGWHSNKDNVKGYPDAYQLREPQKVWDYKVK